MATWYMELPFSSDEVVRDYATTLESYADFDVIVGRGLSGAVMVARVAPMLGKDFVIVRKPGDGTHGNDQFEGTLSELERRSLRWIFLDDFISTGATFRATYESIRRNLPCLEFVGVAEYTALYRRWTPADDPRALHHTDRVDQPELVS